MNETTLEKPIWAEKNLIEPQKNCVSNGEHEASVITTNTLTLSNEQNEKAIAKRLKQREKARRKYARRMADPVRREKLKEKWKRKHERRMSDPIKKEKKLAYLKEYRQKEASKLAKKNYHKLKHVKEAKKNYRKLEHVKEARNKYNKKYKQVHFFVYKAWAVNTRCKAGHRITAKELWSIAKKQKLICPLTGRKLTKDNISLDHITPLTAGGTNEVSNLRFVHHDANVAKHVLSDLELLQLASDIVKTLGGVPLQP